MAVFYGYRVNLSHPQIHHVLKLRCGKMFESRSPYKIVSLKLGLCLLVGKFFTIMLENGTFDQETITRSAQLHYIRVKAFSQTRPVLDRISDEFRFPKEPCKQSQALQLICQPCIILNFALRIAGILEGERTISGRYFGRYWGLTHIET